MDVEVEPQAIAEALEHADRAAVEITRADGELAARTAAQRGEDGAQEESQTAEHSSLSYARR
jgi:hypothetical protein